MPRIIINPKVLEKGDKRDGLCVAWNEAIRVFMEANGYEPQSEPTERQRQFFADTPYADDELQLRRTILARICVFDTSVKDPTDDQLSESASVLRVIIDSGFAKTDDEITKCERLARAIEATVGAQPVEPKEEPLEAAPLEPNRETQAAYDAGEEDEEQLQQAAVAEPDPGADIAADFQNSINQEVEQNLADAGVQPGQTMPEANEAVQDEAAKDGTADTSHIKYGPQPEKTPTMDDVSKALADKKNAASGDTGAEVVIPGDNAPTGSPADVPGLTVGGSRNNIFEYNGRRVSQREAEKLQANAASGGPQQPTGIGGRKLTEGEAKWQKERRASTEAYLARKEAREQRRDANNADRVADRNELLAKANDGTFGDLASTMNALSGNSAMGGFGNDTRDRLRRKYGKFGFSTL